MQNQKSFPTYLYKFKNSSNYFFRIRNGFFDQSDYLSTGQFFVASLKTDVFEDARWLASFISIQLKRSKIMNTDGQETNAFQNDNARGSIFAANQQSKVEKVGVKELGANLRFKNALRAKFKELLQTGKALLDAGVRTMLVALFRTI